MNSQNKVIEIREQEREKQRDSKRKIKNGERGREGVRRFMGAERMRLLKRGMKWYCSLFPFGSLCVFVKLCQITEPKLCAVGARWCLSLCLCVSTVCVYMWKI